MQQLAASAGFASWSQAQQHIHEIVDVIAGFADLARAQGVQASTITAISKMLDSRRLESAVLLGR